MNDAFKSKPSSGVGNVQLRMSAQSAAICRHTLTEAPTAESCLPIDSMAAILSVCLFQVRSFVPSTTKKKEMFYLTTHSTHFIYGYMASDIWLRTILIVKKETRCHHMGYSFRLAVRVLLYAPSHRQDCTYHSLCYTSHGALAGTRNSSMGSPHEGSIRRPIAP